MLTVLTRHVVTSTALLDVDLTSGARSSVLRHPLLVHCIASLIVFLPLLVLVTSCIGMPLHFAVETERKVAVSLVRTAHEWIVAVSNHRIRTACPRTPYEVFHGIQRLVQTKLLVFLELPWVSNVRQVVARNGCLQYTHLRCW